MKSPIYAQLLSPSILAAVVWREQARAINRDTVQCRECRGTGSEDPDCRTCGGHRSIRLKAAYARGWKKADLNDVDESDGYCECPDCEGHSCQTCSGDGTVPFHEQNQQERRVLIFARYQKLPPLCTVDYWGRRHREDQLLSPDYAGDLIESYDAHRFCSVFGDEFYLTEKGKQRYLDLWRAARERAAAARVARANEGEEGR
jgi:hypothetical protein